MATMDKSLCYVHCPYWCDDFEEAIKILKGKVLPKKVVKRSAYLVCNCHKKHTKLDELFDKVDVNALQTHVLAALSRQNKEETKDSDDEKGIASTENSSDEIGIGSTENNDPVQMDTGMDKPSADVVVKSEKPKTDAANTVLSLCRFEANEYNTSPSLGEGYTAEQNKQLETPTTPEIISVLEPEPVENIEENSLDLPDNMILNELLWSDLSGTDVSSCAKRLVVLSELCLVKGETALFEPGVLHMEKTKEFRQLNRGKYFRKVKSSEKKKSTYKVVQNMIIQQPSITISAFIGKQGKNIKTITQDKDCKLSINKGWRVQDINITIHAKSVADSEVIERRVNQMCVSLNYAHREWQRKQIMRQQYRAQIQQAAAKSDRKGPSQWDLDEESKASARDEYNKKVSYQHSKGRTTGSKPHILHEGSRCLNCLVPYSKESNGEMACKYHPGYLDGARWTCCSQKVVSESSITGQKASHQYDGCAGGLHNWRPNKTKKCSSRKEKRH